MNDHRRRGLVPAGGWRTSVLQSFYVDIWCPGGSPAYAVAGWHTSVLQGFYVCWR